ncbi:hypothetical protein OEZ86_007002 [Tetradesmus obliquus]|nr:hypothetical protein OEZ86_007002 [Tetradesmus obliquus]
MAYVAAGKGSSSTGADLYTGDRGEPYLLYKQVAKTQLHGLERKLRPENVTPEMLINLLADLCKTGSDAHVVLQQIWACLGSEGEEAAKGYIPGAQFSAALLARLQKRHSQQRDMMALIRSQDDYKILLQLEQGTPAQRLASPPDQPPHTQPYRPPVAALPAAVPHAVNPASEATDRLLEQLLQQQQQQQQQPVLDVEQGQVAQPQQQPQLLQQITTAIRAERAADAVLLAQQQLQPAVQAHSGPITVQGHSYYPVQVLALKLWLALDIVFGLAGPEETRQYARLGVKGAQGNLSFIAFANQVSKYRQMFAHLETVSLLPATEVFIRGLKDSGMQECARSWLRMQGPMNPLQLAEQLETEYANQ